MRTAVAYWSAVREPVEHVRLVLALVVDHEQDPDGDEGEDHHAGCADRQAVR
jgi:hypothetical protein